MVCSVYTQISFNLCMFVHAFKCEVYYAYVWSVHKLLCMYRPNLVLLRDYIYSVIMRCLHCTMCILCVKYMQDVNTTASPTNMVTPFRQLMVATNG